MRVIGYNYIAAFLTFGCNLQCPYCITRLDGLKGKSNRTGSEWVNFINDLDIKEDVPVTLQGGEPTMHPDFYKIVKGIREGISLNLMTNIQFDVREFSKKVGIDKFNRKAPFPSIRVSYHVGQMDRRNTIRKVKEMTDLGYSIGLYMLSHPINEEEIKAVEYECLELGVDFRLKEYLDRNVSKKLFKYGFEKDIMVKCRITDLIIGPNLRMYRCHYDLYTGKNLIPFPERTFSPQWMPCEYPTKCNPCDVKIKNNRYQNWGYCSAEIETL